MCINCIWSVVSNYIDNHFKVFPKKKRIRISTDDSLHHTVDLIIKESINHHLDINNESIIIHDTPNFIYYDFKKRKDLFQVLRLLSDAELYHHKYSRIKK